MNCISVFFGIAMAARIHVDTFSEEVILHPKYFSVVSILTGFVKAYRRSCGADLRDSQGLRIDFPVRPTLVERAVPRC